MAFSMPQSGHVFVLVLFAQRHTATQVDKGIFVWVFVLARKLVRCIIYSWPTVREMN